MLAALCGNLAVFQILSQYEIKLKDNNNFNAYAWAFFGKQKAIREFVVQNYFQEEVQCYPKEYLANTKPAKQ